MLLGSVAQVRGEGQVKGSAWWDVSSLKLGLGREGVDLQALSGYQPQVCSWSHELGSSLASSDRTWRWERVSVGLGVRRVLTAFGGDVVLWGVLSMGLRPGASISGQDAWSWKYSIKGRKNKVVEELRMKNLRGLERYIYYMVEHFF